MRKSIIRVEIPDINLGEGAPPTQEGVQKDVEMDGAGDSAQETEPMTLSWDDYQRIANLFVLKLRQEEEQAEQLGNVRLLLMLFMIKYVWYTSFRYLIAYYWFSGILPRFLLRFSSPGFSFF